MAYSALLPFIIVFVGFVLLRTSLVWASFGAVVTGTLLNFLLWNATPEAWSNTFSNTSQILVEIGLIIAGSFFFLEVAEATQVMSSLAKLVREITKVRLFQGLLVSFSLALMVEGSSGFGTPFLITIPLLHALRFPLVLCALLPFINVVLGIPFGALGTPIRLGFGAESAITTPILILLIPFMLLAPLVSSILIYAKDEEAKAQFKTASLEFYFFWVLTLCLSYTAASLASSKLGPEFPALTGGLVSFCVGISLIRLFTPKDQKEKITQLKGLFIYFLLLVLLWAGKQIWMDQVIPGTHIRIFNPGWVFILLSLGILTYERRVLKNPRLSGVGLLAKTFHRAKRTVWVLFCMTLTVQIVRNNGALDLLGQVTPNYLTHEGAALLGWFGTMGVGTSTVTNLLLSKIVDPAFHPALAIGSAIGFQLAFQTLVATRAILMDKITERELFRLMAPISFGMIAAVSLYLLFIRQHPL